MTTAQPARAFHGREWIVVVIIAIIAFAVRLSSVMHAGGLHAILGYDEGVYYGAATAFVNGMQPYRDFVLVHPPGSVVLLAPFALIGRLTSDSTGWLAARIFIMLIGAVNAALLYVVARRVSMVAGLTAGLFYAVWAPAVHVERTTMLEAFVLLGITVALWALRTTTEPTWRLIIAGVALGMGAGTKLWGLVPLAVFAAWLLGKRAWRSLIVVTSSAVVTFAVLVGPFLAVSGRRMIDLVIFAQLERGRGGTHELDRLAHMFNVDLLALLPDQRRQIEVGILATAVVVSMCAVAWFRTPTARLWVALLATQWVVLLAVPVYFEGYSSFIAPALALVIGAAAAAIWKAVDPWRAPWRSLARGSIVAVIVVVLFANGYHAARSSRELKPHLRALAGITANARCVGSDSAGLLVMTDTLSRNIQRGCATVLDFDGTIYSIDRGSNPEHLGATERRRSSQAYQQAMRDYFAANDLVIVHRASVDAFDRTTRLALRSRPLIYHQKGLRVFGS